MNKTITHSKTCDATRIRITSNTMRLRTPEVSAIKRFAADADGQLDSYVVLVYDASGDLKAVQSVRQLMGDLSLVIDNYGYRPDIIVDHIYDRDMIGWFSPSDHTCIVYGKFDGTRLVGCGIDTHCKLQQWLIEQVRDRRCAYGYPVIH